MGVIFVILNPLSTQNTMKNLSNVIESWCKLGNRYTRDTHSCSSTIPDINLEALFQDTTSHMVYFNKDALKLFAFPQIIQPKISLYTLTY